MWNLVKTNHFTKCVEAEPLANIQDTDVKRFVRKIVTQFNIPKVLIQDNDLQFDSKTFRRFHGELGIINRYSTPSYPQGNGQVEATNMSVVNGFKRQMNDSKGKGSRSSQVCYGHTELHLNGP